MTLLVTFVWLNTNKIGHLRSVQSDIFVQFVGDLFCFSLYVYFKSDLSVI